MTGVQGGVQSSNGGLASDPASVKVTITGSDDAPTVTVHDLVTADDHSAIKGSAVGADVDTGDVAGATPAIADKLHYALVDGDGNHVSSLTTTHGTVSINADTGEYTFTPNADAAHLVKDQTVDDSFKVVSSRVTVVWPVTRLRSRSPSPAATTRRR
ncbi:Ig-like domain-containing protein [Magnetospirillum sp. 15-1]|uniref:VCBS domain-containing protein n=1 Tax=Magnetospirillum sp. 15-1 TaxID=1979370 RepID=UPI000BBB9274|nr:Ig-like domain-containing protein [Magnetospirillum sp. 15-1]